MALRTRREIVDGWTLNSLATSAQVFFPEVTKDTISICCSELNLGGRPPTRPCLRAAIRPFRVRSRSMSRSNSAKVPMMLIIIRPPGEFVSTDSVRLRNPAPARLISSIKDNRSLRERDRRSSFQTTTTSPSRSCPIKRCSSGRFQLPPDAFSWNMISILLLRSKPTLGQRRYSLEGSGKGLAKCSSVRPIRHITSLWIFALLAILLAYNLDFECMVESPSGRQACHAQSADNCGAPALGAPVTILPSLLVLIVPSCREVSPVLPTVGPQRKPYRVVLCRPPGLRAPPRIRV